MPDVDHKNTAVSPDGVSVSKLPLWTDGIAIIGMSARFPKSRNVQEFWERIVAGESLISDLSEDDLRRAGVDELTIANPDHVRRGSILDGADLFDAEFFGFSKRDAEIIDPQQRVLLECASDAIENAGYTGDSERIGVFAGIGISAYLLQLLANPVIVGITGTYQLILANDKDFAATRIAYKLNLHGPAMTVQTACSTSLAAVHLACQSILAGECEMALAGGVSIGLPQGAGYTYMPGMILSPNGLCSPFDASANGTVPGSGAGLVVLKKLSEAEKDGDTIHAVIRGSAWNNDGSAKAGFTIPSVDGQVDVIRQALNAAGVTANRIGYVEAHGTATELGDPIEVAALKAVFAEDKAAPGACILGSVKSNMGHADTAAGIAGFIKATLAVSSGIIPPTLNYLSPNPYAELEGSPFCVSASQASWQDDRQRWAGVSSFGIGGTNVHAILSAAPEHTVVPERSMPRVYPVSTRSATALTTACDRLANYLELENSLRLDHVAWTLQVGRRKFAHKRAIVAANRAELIAQLRLPQKNQDAPPDLSQNVVFLFPGQGQQFAGMAADLYISDPVFRSIMDEGATILEEILSLNVLDFIVGKSDGVAGHEIFRETALVQPILFLTEYALAKRWQSLGVKPTALLGHSLGELTAAAVAGVFSFADGLRLAAERGQLMGSTSPGIMLAVMLAPEKLFGYTGEDIWIAAENGPKVSVLSGSVDAMEKLERRLAGDRISAVRLATQNAFHTPLMAEAAAAFRLVVESVERHAPSIPWLSNVTGTWISAEEAQSPKYWADQILSRVRFSENLAELVNRPCFFLEVGPGEALVSIARHSMRTSVFASSLGAENRRKSDQHIFLEAAALAWQHGLPISWIDLHPDSKPRRIPLPTYPFERQRYWVDPAASPRARLTEVASPSSAKDAIQADPAATVKRTDMTSWFYVPEWNSTPPASVIHEQLLEDGASWMVLSDSSSLSEALLSRLQQNGAHPIAVSIGETFSTSEQGVFTLNPVNAEDFERLWQEINDLGLRPTRLLNLWTLRGTHVSAYDTLVHLLQAARPHRQRFGQIEVITDQLQSVAGEEIAEVGRAVVFGLMPVIAAEYKDVQCRCIDISTKQADVSNVVSQLLEEIQTHAPGTMIAYRGRTRWQRAWTSAPLREVSESPFRERGVYLITGGTGGIGYIFARYLLQHYQARVVLTARTAMLPRDSWSDWLSTNSVDDPVSRRILRMQELENAGGEVLYLPADVSSRSAMAEVVREAKSRFGQINGVLHAAGVPGGHTLARQDLIEAASVRAPKVEGSVNLAELLCSEELDFLVFCSSISAILPGSTQGAYAAANAFQDSYAEYCRYTLKIPTVAINFDSWQDVGMTVDMVLPEGFESVKEERLKMAIDSSEGMEVFQRILTNWKGSQILASTVEFDILRDRSRQAKLAAPPIAIEAVQRGGSDSELTFILEIWKDVLAVNTVLPSDNFFELGGHSLAGTMVIARVRERFGVILTIRTLFEAPTALELAEVLRSLSETAGVAPADLADTTGDREEFEV